MKLFKKIVSLWVSLTLAGSLFAPVLAAAYRMGGTAESAGCRDGWQGFRWEKARRSVIRAGRTVITGVYTAHAAQRGGMDALDAPAEADAGEDRAARTVQGGAWRVRRGGGTATGTRTVSSGGTTADIRGLAVSMPTCARAASGSGAATGGSAKPAAQNGSVKRESEGAGQALPPVRGTDTGSAGTPAAAGGVPGSPGGEEGSRAVSSAREIETVRLFGSIYRGFPVLPLSEWRGEGITGGVPGFPYRLEAAARIPGGGVPLPAVRYVFGGARDAGNGAAGAALTGGAEVRAAAEGIQAPALFRDGCVAELVGVAHARQGALVALSGRDGGAQQRLYIRIYENHPTGRGDAPGLEAFRLGWRALAVAVDEYGNYQVRGGWNLLGEWIAFEEGGAQGSTGGGSGGDGAALLRGQDWRRGLAAPAAAGTARPMADAAETGDSPQGWEVPALVLALACLVLLLP